MNKTLFNLSGKQFLITGVGIKPLTYEFHHHVVGNTTHVEINQLGTRYKANIGATTALTLATFGARVILVARAIEKLEIVRKWIIEQVPSADVITIATDLSKQEAVSALVKSLPNDLPTHWIHSVGLGGGTVAIKDDNPYVSIAEIDTNLINAELGIVNDTVYLLQKLLEEKFSKQNESRICIVSSMSASRSVPYGSIHNAAKAAISRFANAAMLELQPKNIFVTDIRPGLIDTGMYDSLVVRKSVLKIFKAYGYDYTVDSIPAASPLSVATAILQVVSSNAHVTSVNLVAQGQFPHEAS